MPDASVDYVFSEHFIEHLTLAQAEELLSDVHRVLRPGGIVRLTTPDLRTLIREYQSGRLDYWRDVDWVAESPARLVNQGMRFWGHQFLYDRDEITRVLQDCGFAAVNFVAYHSSDYEELRRLERRPFRDEIIVEAIR